MATLQWAVVWVVLHIGRWQLVQSQTGFVTYPLKPFMSATLATEAYPAALGGQPARAGDPAITPQCSVDYTTLLLALLQGQDWAARMWDAEGQPQAGQLNGATHLLGSYDECLRVKSTNSAVPISPGVVLYHGFHSRYCRGFYEDSLLKVSSSQSVCAPDTCTADDIQNILRANTTSNPSPMNVTSMQCTGSEPTYVEDPLAITVTVILVLFCLLVLVATLFEYGQTVQEDKQCEATRDSTTNIAPSGPKAEQEADIPVTGVTEDPEATPGGHVIVDDEGANGNLNTQQEAPQDKAKKQTEQNKCVSLLLCFSLLRTVPRVLGTTTPSGDYSSFHGVRSLSFLWIVFGHAYQLGITAKPRENYYSIVNPSETTVFDQQWEYSAIRNMSLAVNAFFLLSSCLTTLSFLRLLEKTNGKPGCRNMALYYFHRYWRLTVVYLMIMLTFMGLFAYWGSGPLFPYDFSEAESCKANFWVNFLYLNNFLGLDRMCMSWSWYLACDFQMYCLAPLFIYVFYRSAIGGGILLGIMFAISIIGTSVLWSLVWQGQLSWFIVYANPVSRLQPYCIGIVLGYIMFRTKCKLPIHPIVQVIGWVVAMLLIQASIYGDFNRGFEGYCTGCNPWSLGLASFYQGTTYTYFSLGIAWILLVCLTGHGGFVNTILSWKAWVTVGKLSYTGYLIHPIIIYLTIYSQRQMLYFQHITYVTLGCGYIVLTLGAAFVFTVVFEVPALYLEKMILPRH